MTTLSQENRNDLTVSRESSRQGECAACMAPFQVISNVKQALHALKADITEALDEVKNKVMLYLDHQKRCKNQEQRITERFEGLSRDRSKCKSCNTPRLQNEVRTYTLQGEDDGIR